MKKVCTQVVSEGQVDWVRQSARPPHAGFLAYCGELLEGSGRKINENTVKAIRQCNDINDRGEEREESLQ